MNRSGKDEFLLNSVIGIVDVFEAKIPFFDNSFSANDVTFDFRSLSSNTASIIRSQSFRSEY